MPWKRTFLLSFCLLFASFSSNNCVDGGVGTRRVNQDDIEFIRSLAQQLYRRQESDGVDVNSDDVDAVHEVLEELKRDLEEKDVAEDGGTEEMGGNKLKKRLTDEEVSLVEKDGLAVRKVEDDDGAESELRLMDAEEKDEKDAIVVGMDVVTSKVEKKGEDVVGVDKKVEDVVGVDKEEDVVGVDKKVEDVVGVDKKVEDVVGVDKMVEDVVGVDKKMEDVVGVDKKVEDVTASKQMAPKEEIVKRSGATVNEKKSVGKPEEAKTAEKKVENAGNEDPKKNSETPTPTPDVVIAPLVAEGGSSSDGRSETYLIIMISACCAFGLLMLFIASMCYYNLRTKKAQTQEVPYMSPASPVFEYKSVPGHNNMSGYDPSYGSYPSDNGLAVSAAKFHFLHEKEKLIAMENEKSQTEPVSTNPVDCSTDVYEQPGMALAMPTEIEVDNPIFVGDVTPGTTPRDHTPISARRSDSEEESDGINNGGYINGDVADSSEDGDTSMNSAISVNGANSANGANSTNSVNTVINVNTHGTNGPVNGYH